MTTAEPHTPQAVITRVTQRSSLHSAADGRKELCSALRPSERCSHFQGTCVLVYRSLQNRLPTLCKVLLSSLGLQASKDISLMEWEPIKCKNKTLKHKLKITNNNNCIPKYPLQSLIKAQHQEWQHANTLKNINTHKYTHSYILAQKYVG